MRMLRTGEYAQLASQHLAPEGRLGQHAVDRALDDALRVLGEYRFDGVNRSWPMYPVWTEVSLLLVLRPVTRPWRR